jgi:hypothetical protein
MRLTLLTALPLCAVLSACASNGTADSGSATSPPPLVATPDDGGVQCDNEVLKAYVGKQPTQAVLDEAKARSGARSVRVAQPGMAMTMDFRADRLTVMVGEDGRIEVISCG